MTKRYVCCLASNKGNLILNPSMVRFGAPMEETLLIGDSLLAELDLRLEDEPVHVSFDDTELAIGTEVEFLVPRGMKARRAYYVGQMYQHSPVVWVNHTKRTFVRASRYIADNAAPGSDVLDPNYDLVHPLAVLCSDATNANLSGHWQGDLISTTQYPNELVGYREIVLSADELTPAEVA